MGFTKGFANVFKDMATSKAVVKDWAGKANRMATNKRLLIGAGVGLGLYGASRMSNNRYVRGVGNMAGMAGLGAAGWAGGRMAFNRYGGAFKGAAETMTGQASSWFPAGSSSEWFPAGSAMKWHPSAAARSAREGGVPAYMRRNASGAMRGAGFTMR